MAVQHEPGDEEILALCAPAVEPQPGSTRTPGSQRPLPNGLTIPISIPDVSGNPFNFNMHNSSMVVENSELQIGPKIITTAPLGPASNGAPFLTVGEPFCLFGYWHFYDIF